MNVGICGCIGFDINLVNGQTIKTKEFIRYIKNRNDVEYLTVDTWKWRRRPLKLLYNFIRLFFFADRIFLFPAHNGVKVFIPLAMILKFFFKTEVYYMVIGGWLPDLLKRDKWLIRVLGRIDCVCVETQAMIEDLKELDVKNTKIIHNCKSFSVSINKTEKTESKFRFCTFSRVMREKGIEDAIYAIKKLNDNEERKYTLDIYGPIDDDYKDAWNRIVKELPKEIRYCGELDYSEAIKTLSNYRALLFPTYFDTEGLPGTIIDAYCAGIPVIAYRWRSADEFILNNKTGWIINGKDKEELARKISYVNARDIEEIKIRCKENSMLYLSDNVLKNIL